MRHSIHLHGKLANDFVAAAIRESESPLASANGCAPRPVIVCLCGSTRFMDAFQRANLTETIAGKIVLSIGCNTKSDSDLLALGELTPEAKTRLDELHKRKIELADEILVLNVGGYIGESTRSEIIHASNLKKTIRLLDPFVLPECKAALDAMLKEHNDKLRDPAT